MTTNEEQILPNHHAHHRGFSGPSGLLAALSMLVGRSDDARWAGELAGLEPGDDLIDIGCGPGVAARDAARQGARVVGVDPAPVMLRVARRTTPRSLDVRFVEGAAETLPIEDGAASIVWALATTHHWGDLDRALDEMRRVLRPGGRAVVIERRTVAGATGLASHGWTAAQADAFVDRLRDHGFESCRVEHHDAGRRRLVGVAASVP
jgi:ubiquinone/menaquinone biosynthesis C-methylase UbiE